MRLRSSFCKLSVAILSLNLFYLIFLPTILLYLPENLIYGVRKTSARISLIFDDYVDDEWYRDLKKFLKFHAIDWDFRNYTSRIAYCNVTCDDQNHEKLVDNQLCNTKPIFFRQEIRDNFKFQSTSSRAVRSLPCFLKIANSSIPNANAGVFTSDYWIPKNVIFGPYEGVIRQSSTSDYAWRVFNLKTKSYMHIDALDEETSNWLRFVNSARYFEEQNLFPLLFNNSVYYITFKDVPPSTELLIWYGQAFARNTLNITLTDDSKHFWFYFFAPRFNLTASIHGIKTKL